MNETPKYRVVGSRVIDRLTGTNSLVKYIETTFEWGEGHSGVVELPQATATQDALRAAILRHISLFDGL